MASLPADGLDDLLFEFYKKEVLKHLITKMTPEMVRTLQRLKDGGPSTSDIGDCKLKLESFLASFVAGEDVHTTTDSEFLLGSLKSRLESMFGSILSKEDIARKLIEFITRYYITSSFKALDTITGDIIFVF